MLTFEKTARVAVALFLCLILAACSQTAMSTYSGKIGKGGATTEEMRQKKILAARARARKARIAKREAFLARRKAALAKANTPRSSKPKAAKASKKRNGVKKKVRKTSRKSKAKSSVAKRTARKKGTLGKSRRRTIKSKKAFAPRAGKLNVRKPWNCVPKRLKRVINQVRKKWGSVTITSTHRSHRRNRLVGGKRRSYHLRCQAVDFKVHGSSRGLLRWLARHPQVGGYSYYRSTGHYHIDTGPKRSW